MEWYGKHQIVFNMEQLISPRKNIIGNNVYLEENVWSTFCFLKWFPEFSPTKNINMFIDFFKFNLFVRPWFNYSGYGVIPCFVSARFDKVIILIYIITWLFRLINYRRSQKPRRYWILKHHSWSLLQRSGVHNNWSGVWIISLR